MKFLADESIDVPVILLLRQHGFDVRSVSEEFPSKEDEFVLESANIDDRVLITSDKDFGELVYRLKKTSKGCNLVADRGVVFSGKGGVVIKSNSR